MGRTDPIPHDSLVGVHVLVVDDDADTRYIIETVLRYCGALVTAAASAREALEVIRRMTPDVLLSDISMPREDGYWLLRELRKLPADEGGAVPAVAITAHPESHSPERTLSAGFQLHLAKPFDPWELCRAVASVIRKS